jgi:hypothetical protein
VAAFAREEHLVWGIGVVPTGKAAGHNEVLAGLRSAGTPMLELHPYDPLELDVSSSAYEMGYYPFLRVMRSGRWGHPLEIVHFP